MKKRKNEITKLQNILDSNYFHICVESDAKGILRWKVYYNNLPSQIYFSKKNKPLLTSETNAISDIYKLRDKFEKAKSQEFKRNIVEYINVNREIFYLTLNIKYKCSYILIDFFMISLIISIINLLFINNVEFELLHFLLVIFMAIIGTYRLTQIEKESKKGQERIKEAFIKDKIRRQGLYFVQRLKKGDTKNDI